MPSTLWQSARLAVMEMSKIKSSSPTTCWIGGAGHGILGQVQQAVDLGAGVEVVVEAESSPLHSMPLDSMPMSGLALMWMPPGSVAPSSAAGVCIPA